MNCLCCDKPLKTQDTPYQWHKSCIKNFFGTNKFPDIDVSEEILNQLAIDSTTKGYTVPGVQKKLSLHLTTGTEPRLTLVNYPTGYILKPQTAEYSALPEMEYLVMQMAKASGIKTVPFALVKLASQNDAFAYITKRIDRENGQMLAMEDFCQLEGRLTEDKYRGSYERCGKIVSKYSANPGLDLAEMYFRIIFSFAVGNSDMHLKNFSLYSKANKQYNLTPAYDMLSTALVMPEDIEELALTLNGKKRKIRKSDFEISMRASELEEKVIGNIFNKFLKVKDKWFDFIDISFLPEEMKIAYKDIITNRLILLN